MAQELLEGIPTRGKIVAVTSGKGGVGKTTTSVTLSCALALRGFKVALCDADSQGASTAWFASAPADRPLPADIYPIPSAGRSLSKELDSLSLQYQIVVIDLPNGLREEAPMSALLVSDMTISPTRAAPSDVRTCMIDTSTMVRQARKLNSSLKHRILVNMYRKTNIANSLLAVMSGAGAPLLRNRIGDRTAFQLAAGIGSVPSRMGSAYKVAAGEVDLVAAEIQDVLFGGAP